MKSNVTKAAQHEAHDDNPLQGANVWQSLFDTFDEDAFFENLHNKVKDTSYYHKYKSFVALLHGLSYLFNAASAFAASYLVYHYINWLTGSPIAGYIIGGLFLIALEVIKRMSSTEFWQVFWFKKRHIAWGWLLLSLGCLLISLASSAGGVKKGTDTYSPPVALLEADSMANYYAAEIEKLEAENAELEANKDENGTTYYKLYDAINANKAIITEYRRKKMALDEKTEGKNDMLTEEYQASVEFTGWTMAAITALMELLFECCIGFIWYYKFRSYVERTATQGTPQSESPTKAKKRPPSPPLGITQADFQQMLSLLQEIKQTKPEHVNGSDISSFSARTPIGFQRNPVESSVQACTDVYRDDDRYTVSHVYQKAGETHTARYTLPQVTARINQYQRELTQAEVQGLGEEVINNRKRWLKYWEGKQLELLEKIQQPQAIG